MAALARFTNRWWWAVILAWLAAAALAYVAAPPFSEVATYDETAFLPPGSDAVQGGKLLEDGWPGQSFSQAAVVAFVHEEQGITEADRRYIEEFIAWAESDRAPETLARITAPSTDPRLEQALTAEDGQALLVIVGLEVQPFTPKANEAVAALRQHIDETPPPEGLDVYVTGTAAVAADNNAAIQESVERAHLITLVLVIAILLFVFRSPIAPLVPLATIGVAYLTARSVVSLLAGAGLEVSSLFETFAVVIVFGAGTDYCLLLVSRFHDELEGAAEAGYERGDALRQRTLVATVTILGGVIAASAVTVIVGFSAQSVAQFGLYRTLGPAMAIAVAVTLAAGLTLTPALMRMFGSALFWPHRAKRHTPAGEELLIERTDTTREEVPV